MHRHYVLKNILEEARLSNRGYRLLELMYLRSVLVTAILHIEEPMTVCAVLRACPKLISGLTALLAAKTIKCGAVLQPNCCCYAVAKKKKSVCMTSRKLALADPISRVCV